MKARKRFGQNFLHDKNIIDRIVRSIAPKASDNLIEIGPGRGAITQLLYASCPNLTAIEIDRDLAKQLQLIYPKINLIEADILKQDLTNLGQQMRIVGNLPYNISTPILFKLFAMLPNIKDMFFMLQLEVVERLAAEPRSSNYGRLSVMSQYYCDSRLLFQVPPEAFTPRPKVTSAIVQLRPKPDRNLANNEAVFAELVTQAFSMRRKTLRNSLKGYISSESIFKDLDIDPQRRPETLTLDEFIGLANASDAAQT